MSEINLCTLVAKRLEQRAVPHAQPPSFLDWIIVGPWRELDAFFTKKDTPSENSWCPIISGLLYYLASTRNLQDYFQVSSRTVFSVALLQCRVPPLSLMGNSVQWALWSAIFWEFKGVHQPFKRCDRAADVWKLNEQRVEEAWFLWKCVSIFDKCTHHIDSSLLYSQTSHHLDIESFCENAWDTIVEIGNEWIHHSCPVKGCSEGYVTVDGIEKVRQVK